MPVDGTVWIVIAHGYEMKRAWCVCVRVCAYHGGGCQPDSGRSQFRGSQQKAPLYLRSPVKIRLAPGTHSEQAKSKEHQRHKGILLSTATDDNNSLFRHHS